MSTIQNNVQPPQGEDVRSTSSPLVLKIWTNAEVQEAKTQVVKNNWIQLGIGWFLMIVTAFFFPKETGFGGESIDLLKFPGCFVGGLFLVGLWFGLIKWIGLDPKPYQKIEYYKKASHLTDWLRNTTCSNCKKEVVVNMGLY